jgi:vancomycin permeability regulator SanA
LQDYFPDGFRAVLVTNDFHIFRTSYIASRIGIDATRAGAETQTVSIPSNYIREILAIANTLVFPPWGSGGNS